MIKLKKWAFVFFGTVLSLLLCIMALVVFVDPFFQYHKPLQGFPYVVDNQLSQNPGMAKNMEYDSIILGSSMTFNFETDWFKELYDLKTIKLSYSGAYARDQYNIMKIAFGSKNTIKKVFLGIDPLTYSSYVEEIKFPIPEYLYDRNLFNDIPYLLNKEVLLNYIVKPIITPEDKTDMSKVYKLWYTDPYFTEELVLSGYTAPEQVEEETPTDEFVERTIRNMETNILPFIEQNPDTEFVVFFPPYSILYWNNMLRENRLEATLRQFEVISEKLLAYDNVKLFLFSDIKDIITDLNNYADYTHYHTRINYYMTECFGNDDCILTLDILQERINRMREIATSYDYESLLGQTSE